MLPPYRGDLETEKKDKLKLERKKLDGICGWAPRVNHWKFNACTREL